VAGLIEIFVGLLVIVAALGWLARKIKVPYPILFVIGGLVFGLVPGMPQIRLNPDFVFLFFLPPLLYPAALFTSWRDFHANLRPISMLAIGLVLFTIVTVGLLTHYFIGLPLAAGFVLGAIISPPDAIAATSIAKRLKVPRRVVTILEGESLVNDATALVAYRFGIAAVVTGTFSMAKASWQFVVVGVGGVAVGLLIGWFVVWVHRHIEDSPVEVTVSLLTPFIAYLAAERLHVSGVLAVVTAGLILGWRAPEITSSRTRLQAGAVWGIVEFILNGCVFTLIGLQLPEVMRALASRALSLRQVLWYGVVISIAVVLIRLLWVFPATVIPRLIKSIREKDPMPPWQNVLIVGWTGMRGVVSLAAAMALPLQTHDGSPFPGRELILFLTFTVILVTLVVQGLSLPFIIRWLGIKDDGGAENEEREARLKANEAALARLREMRDSNPSRDAALERLRVEYDDRIHQLTTVESEEYSGPPHLFSSDYERLSREALDVERRMILQLRNDRIISDAVLRRIQQDIDLAEARLIR
jgi:monovalent cation/hydrogen antiporter